MDPNNTSAGTAGTYDNMAVVLATIDERTKHMNTQIKQLRELVEGHYVTQQEFKPIKAVVYGITGSALIAVVGGLLALVIRGG